MSSIVVFGAKGLLGASLVPLLTSLGHTVLSQSRSEGADLFLDPNNQLAVLDLLTSMQPDVVINLAAATNVDQCETHPNLAWLANANVVKVLTECIASVRKKFGTLAHLVHISTDQVYDGSGPHSEDDVNLVNVYGLTKYTGELLAERIGATVLRTNFVGRSRCALRVSFSDWLIASLKNQTPITVFADVKFSALHIDTLCDVIAKCIENRPIGIFNAGCRDSISKAEFAFALANALTLTCDQVSMGISIEAALKARRPIDMSLQVSRLESALGIQLPTMRTEIELVAKEYLND